MLDDLWNQRTRPAATIHKLTGEIDALPLGARWVEFYNLMTIGEGLLRLDSYHTSNMLLDNDSGFGTVPADKTHVHVLMARLAPLFAAFT